MPDKPSPAWHDSERWLKTLEEVASFKATHGVLPGDKDRSPRERALQQWVRRQRVKEQNGELTALQVQGLDLVDGDWRANQSGLSWENNLAAAILEFQESGRVPANGEGSGHWLLRQRSRMSTGSLSPDQLQALDDGIPGWRNLDRIKWAEHARELQEYAARTGSLPTSRSKDPEALRLYTWLAWQRKRAREGRLDEAQAAELNGISDRWRGRNAGKP